MTLLLVGLTFGAILLHLYGWSAVLLAGGLLFVAELLGDVRRYRKPTP